MFTLREKIIKKVFTYGLIGWLMFPNVGFSQENIPLSDCSYTLKDRGKEIGHIHYQLKESVYEGTSCYEVLKEDVSEGKWLGMKNKIEGKEKAYISKEGNLLYFEREETHNMQSPFFKCKLIRKIEGIIKDKNKILIEESEKYNFNEGELGEEKISKKEIDLSKVNCLSYNADLPIINPIIKLSIGEKKKIVLFDPESQSISEGEIEVKEKTKIKISGKEEDSYLIVGKVGRERISLWISEDGRIMLKRKSPGEEIELKSGQ